MGRAIQGRLADSGIDVVGWDRDAVGMLGTFCHAQHRIGRQPAEFAPRPFADR